MSASEFDWPEEMPEGFFWAPKIGDDGYCTKVGHSLYVYTPYSDRAEWRWAWSGLAHLGSFCSFESAYTALRKHVLRERVRDGVKEMKDRLASMTVYEAGKEPGPLKPFLHSCHVGFKGEGPFDADDHPLVSNCHLDGVRWEEMGPGKKLRLYPEGDPGRDPDLRVKEDTTPFDEPESPEQEDKPALVKNLEAELARQEEAYRDRLEKEMQPSEREERPWDRKVRPSHLIEDLNWLADRQDEILERIHNLERVNGGRAHLADPKKVPQAQFEEADIA